MCNVSWACVRIGDEGRRHGGDEKAKSRPGNETAGGIRTKFTRDWPRDVHARDMHDTCSEKKKAANPDNFYHGQITCNNKIFQFQYFSGSNSIDIYNICGFRCRQHRDRCALLSEMLQGRRLIIFHIVCILRNFRFYKKCKHAMDLHTSRNLFYTLARII